MSKIPEDEKVGPFFIRARALKGVWTSIVIDKATIASRFEGFDGEEPALEAARAWATEQSAARRAAAPRGASKKPLSAERRSVDELRAKFAKHFPGGFTDPEYVRKERADKDAAAVAANAAVPLEVAHRAGAAEALAAIPLFGKLRLSPFEIARAKKTLESGAGGAFLQGCAQLADGDPKAGLAAIEAAVRPHGTPSWTLATYLPSLWAPDACMLMRITATVRVANWLGHEFAAKYHGGLDAEVYAAYLDFARSLQKSLAPMAPRDLTDVQGFIWVVSEYD